MERNHIQQRQTLGIVGTSRDMQRAVERLEQVAPTDLTVLITGESGTGKEVFARSIHQYSKRHRQRMVSVNCGAIPETLLESELFGNEKGAFTGATEQRKGFFEAADKGTIFLDEIGEMPIGTQVKLLRVLETGEFSRVGSPDMLRVDVRIVAATNRRLEDEVDKGTFRRDLFYRLNTVQIWLPPLREHPEDIPQLVEHFARRTAEKLDIVYEGITDDALQVLLNLPWTGNVRELRNTIETLVTLEKGKQITLNMLRPYLPLALKPSSLQASHTLHDTLHDAVHDGVHETYSPHRADLVHLRGKTAEQVERELMYKALLDMAGEISGLREEVSQMKELLYDHVKDNEHAAAQQTSAQEHGNSSSLALVPFQTPMPTNRITAHPSSHQSTQDSMPPLRLDEAEKHFIILALERFEGNRRLAAQELGISERTLYRKLHEYGLIERFGAED